MKSMFVILLVVATTVLGNPILGSYSTRCTSNATGMIASNELAYFTCGGVVTLVNTTNPNAIIEISSIKLPIGLEEPKRYGMAGLLGKGIVVTGKGMLYILNTTNLTEMVVASTVMINGCDNGCDVTTMNGVIAAGGLTIVHFQGGFTKPYIVASRQLLTTSRPSDGYFHMLQPYYSTETYFALNSGDDLLVCNAEISLFPPPSVIPQCVGLTSIKGWKPRKMTVCATCYGYQFPPNRGLESYIIASLGEAGMGVLPIPYSGLLTSKIGNYTKMATTSVVVQNETVFEVDANSVAKQSWDFTPFYLDTETDISISATADFSSAQTIVDADGDFYGNILFVLQQQPGYVTITAMNTTAMSTNVVPSVGSGGGDSKKVLFLMLGMIIGSFVSLVAVFFVRRHRNRAGGEPLTLINSK